MIKLTAAEGYCSRYIYVLDARPGLPACCCPESSLQLAGHPACLLSGQVNIDLSDSHMASCPILSGLIGLALSCFELKFLQISHAQAS